MKLHENKQLFRNYIAQTEEKGNIPAIIVEKDYYVTLVLKYLYEFNNEIVFIGGTALSKGFDIIKRFSEDIDISVRKGTNKKAQKVTHEIIENIKQRWEKTGPIIDDNKISQDFKVVFLQYGENEIDNIEETDKRVRLELLTFNDPFPTEEKMIAPYIMEHMSDADKKIYEVTKIKVITQTPFRTMFEKILLQKELYGEFLETNEEDDDQIRRARDFYDIHKIWEYYDKKLPFDEKMMLEILNSRNKNKHKVEFDNLNDYKLSEIYIKRDTKKQLEQRDKKKLSIRDLNCDDIEKSLQEIDCALSQYT